MKKHFSIWEMEILMTQYTNHDNFRIHGSLTPRLNNIVTKAYVIFLSYITLINKYEVKNVHINLFKPDNLTNDRKQIIIIS